MATDQERNLFATLVLGAVGRQAGHLPPSKLTGFLAMEGSAYPSHRDLMVVGRAVNDWDVDGYLHGVRPCDLDSTIFAREYAKRVQESVTGNGCCPMTWVSEKWGKPQGGYNTKRSAFWRCIRNIVEQMGIVGADNPDWASYLVWSNLYKVSPKGGNNPSKKLQKAQLDGCKQLFRVELNEYMPSRLLLLTGAEWGRPFLHDTDLEENRRFKYVEQFGSITLGDKRQTRCVVAAHPQCKPENVWVNEVVEAFERNP